MVPMRKKPEDVSVQLNIMVPYWFREHLITIANKRNTSTAALVRETLMQQLGPHGRSDTAKAGATR